MIGQDYADVFEVINGPEDGMEFPISRTPVDIGRDPGCGIHVGFDPDLKPFHARVTVVSEGYRIRRLAGSPVYVNGKRVGMIRSRIVRHGGFLLVGNTELAVRCVADGLASRSMGLPSESDIGWLLRILARGAARTLWWMMRLLRALTGRLFWWLLLLAAGAAALWTFRPATLYTLWYQLLYWYDLLHARLFGY